MSKVPKVEACVFMLRICWAAKRSHDSEANVRRVCRHGYKYCHKLSRIEQTSMPAFDLTHAFGNDVFRNKFQEHPLAHETHVMTLNENKH